jgi:hypothetical protein
MPNLVAYNSGSTIPNSIQFGTIAMDVNGDVPKGSLIWCPDFGICNQYIIITDSFTNGETNQLSARAMGFQTSGLTDVASIQGINRLALSKSSGPFVTLSDAINWAIYEGYFITNQEYPAIVTSGCVLNLDSNFPPSYPLVFNSWYDLTGNGNMGLLNNGITYNSALRGSLSLNGTNQYVSFNETTNIPVGNSNYTISTWFNPSSLGDKGLVGWGNYGTTNAVNALRLSSSGIMNYWWNNDLSASYSFTTNNWYNAVATFNGTTRSIWVDGSLISSDTPVGHNVPNSTNLTVGVTNTTEYFAGNMGEVQIFNRALSSTEITQNYNALLPRYNGTYTDPCNSAPQCTPTPTTTPFVTASITPTPSTTPYNFDSCSSYDLYGGTTGTQFQYIICTINNNEPVSTYVEAGNIMTNICVIDSYGVIAFNGDGYYTLNGSCSIPPTPTPTPSNTPIPIVIDVNTKINIFFDSSGSMQSTLAPLEIMRNVTLKNCLLPFYNNDSAKYDSMVTVTSIVTERPLNWFLTTSGSTANVSKVINLAFTDESTPYGAGQGQTFNSNIRTPDYSVDINLLRTLLNSVPNSEYYRAVIFRVQGYNQFKDLLSAVFNGTNAYSGTRGLSDKTNVVTWVQDVTEGSNAQYYTNQVVAAINSLGYNLSPC